MDNPKPPLLYPSTNYDIQEIQLFKGSKVLANEISDTVALLKNGILSNLSDPVDNKDCANLRYLKNRRVKPVGPNNSVQYVKDGFLQGSSNFTFNGTTLTSDIITNGTVIFGGGTISGITTESTDTNNTAASKDYVDSTTFLTESTLIVNSSITYSSSQMVNGIIYRDPITESSNNTKFDMTSSAVSIISQFKNPEVGNSALFYLKNISSDPNVFIYLRSGVGVSFNTNSGGSIIGVTIPQNYILKSRLVITSSNTILFYIQSIEYSGNMTNLQYLVTTNSLIPYNLRTILTDSLKVTDSLWYNYNDDELVSTLNSSVIPWSAILNGQFTRKDQGANITMYFAEPASSLFSLQDYSGYYPFIFRNGDSTYTVTLNQSSGYSFDTNASFVVQPMTSLLIWFYLDSINNNIKVYSIGYMSLT